MAKIKIIEVLKSLSSEEMRLLDKFVKSPVHNKHEQVIKLFIYLRKNINKETESYYGDKLLKKLFPEQPLEKQTLHYISSYLLQSSGGIPCME